MVVGRRRRSIGSQQALGRRRRSLAEIDVSLVTLVDRVTRRMRDASRVGRTVTLRLRFDDFTRATRAHTLPLATAHTGIVLGTARTLLTDAAELIEQEGLTMVGVAVSNLYDSDAVQLALPFDRSSTEALDTAVDLVRHRFGAAALGRARPPGPGPGLDDADASRLESVRRSRRSGEPQRPDPIFGKTAAMQNLLDLRRTNGAIILMAYRGDW